MNRNVQHPSLLACFHRNGAVCSEAELAHLSSPEKSLLAVLSYCLLSCKDHIVYSHEQIVINFLCREAATSWEIENWTTLPPSLQRVLENVFASTAMLPPMTFGSANC